MSSADIVYGYYKVPVAENFGYLCVMLDRPPKGVEGTYKASFAFCSPEDNFNRKLARKIASCRMKSKRGNFFVSFNSTSKKLGDLFPKALQELNSSNLKRPRWFSSDSIVPLIKGKKSR